MSRYVNVPPPVRHELPLVFLLHRSYVTSWYRSVLGISPASYTVRSTWTWNRNLPQCCQLSPYTITFRIRSLFAIFANSDSEMLGAWKYKVSWKYKTARRRHFRHQHEYLNICDIHLSQFKTDFVTIMTYKVKLLRRRKIKKTCLFSIYNQIRGSMSDKTKV